MGIEMRTAYKRAFQQFSEKVRALQQLTASPAAARADIEAAILDVERAHQAYSQTRDALAQQLLGLPPVQDLPARLDLSRAHTAEVAELLWESAGKPEGTSEYDWRRAEEIIRLASQEALRA